MKKKVCVYNQTRQSFLSLGVNVADTFYTSMKGLLGKRHLRNDEGLWVIPSQGVHTIGVQFPIDLVYLDANRKVVHLVEHLRPFRIAPIKSSSVSVLELPVRTICRSDTRIGDTFMICSAGEVEHGWHYNPAQTRGDGVWQKLKAWFFAPEERRESKRMSLPLVAYYWNGATPQPYEVKGVSHEGAYIVTPDRWYMGTVLRLTFQLGNGVEQGAPSHVVRAKLIRFGPDGIGVRLIYLSQEERVAFKKFLAKAKSFHS